MRLVEKIQKLENKKFLFLTLLFLSSLFFRYPALFNDYYDVDELAAFVQTREYLAGDIPGKDFEESKKPLYHLIFKGSYKINEEYGWAIVHFITIIFVFLTACFIYLTGSFLNDFTTGAVSAFIYTIFISCFNKDFMATNGEVLYNLFLAGGLYFIVRSISAQWHKKTALIIISLIMGYAAFQIKFHGIILFIYTAFFYLLYYPYYKYIDKRRYFIIAVISIIGAAIVSYLILNSLSPASVGKIRSKINYAIAGERHFTLLHYITRFVYRHSLFLLWHMVLWIPAIVYVKRFIRNKFKDSTPEKSAVAVFFIITYLMVFGGGPRLYYHYFMPAYITLSVIAATVLLNRNEYSLNFIRKRLPALFLIPVVFFMSWNTKDIIIKHFYPNAFYNEGKFLFWTRAVLTGRYNTYLLPNIIYKDVVEYIKKNTRRNDRIFVWGIGPEIYYYSERRLGGITLWPKQIFLIPEYYKKKDKKSLRIAKYLDNKFVNILKKKKPLLFIDTSGNEEQKITEIKLIRPAVFNVSVSEAPLVKKYLAQNYKSEAVINGMTIYRRITGR